MFKKSIILSLAVLLLVSVLSCAYEPSKAPSDATDAHTYEALLEALEKKLSEMQDSYLDSNAEAKNEIERLKAEIEKIKNAANNTTVPQVSVTTAPHILRYKINEGKATISGVVGEERNIVIPSIIDGFEVSAINEKAFSGSDIKSVVISDGIETIDWFAFSECKNLLSITIPKSVKQIGYGAFDGTPNSFTIYCYKDSFAEAYAKSYGLPYAFI